MVRRGLSDDAAGRPAASARLRSDPPRRPRSRLVRPERSSPRGRMPAAGDAGGRVWWACGADRGKARGMGRARRARRALRARRGRSPAGDGRRATGGRFQCLCPSCRRRRMFSRGTGATEAGKRLPQRGTATATPPSMYGIASTAGTGQVVDAERIATRGHSTADN